MASAIDHYDHITQLLEKGENVNVINLDFAKAFDKVDFQVILKKNKTTWNVDVKSGVPQESILDPLLFLVLMGDIDHTVASAFLSSFADDTRVLKGIATQADVQDLQLDLDAICQWGEDNNMTFNSNKFEWLRYGYNHELKENTSYLYSDGQPITVVDNVKDLGITMSSDGTFKNHINTAIHTANHLCGWTLRTFYSRHRQPMLTLWKTLIRPKLDYCFIRKNPRNPTPVILGATEGDIFVLSGKKTGTLPGYLPVVNTRRPGSQFSGTDSEIKSRWHQRRGRYCQVPHVGRSGTTAAQNLRLSSFAVHAPRLFNSPPDYIRNTTDCSLNVFKGLLDTFLASVPGDSLIRGYTAYRRADTNSLLDMVRFATAQSMLRLEEPDKISDAGGGHLWSP